MIIVGDVLYGLAIESDSFVIESAPGPSLSISKTVETASTPVPLGDPVTYTIVVANNGGTDAVDVHVTDTLPSGVIGTDLDWTGAVTAGEQVEFVIPATVTDDVAFYDQTIENTGCAGHSRPRRKRD